MRTAVVVATCRPDSLDRLAASLLDQSSPPVAAYAVLDGPAAAASRPPRPFEAVPYESPPFYAEEMALNAGADRALAEVNPEAIVFLADLTELDPPVIGRLEAGLDRAMLVAGCVCLHGEDGRCVGYTFPQEEHARSAADLVADPLGGYSGPVAARHGFIYFVCTAVRADVFRAVNGFDERFCGANGYIDTNIARRIEAQTGRRCHLHTGIRAHRRDYRLLNLPAPKRKLFAPERNARLADRIEAEEILHGRLSAVRLYRGAATEEPKT